MELRPSFFCLFFCLLYFFLPPFEELGCFSGCLMSSAGIQKLFCGIYSTFKCSFDEFVGEKVFSPSYSSAILAPPSTPVLLPSKSHGWRSLVGCSPRGHKESDTTERLHFHFSLACIGERNGNPLQCSCLENPRDGEAWWAAVSGVTQSRTRLKQLSSSSSDRIWASLVAQTVKNLPAMQETWVQFLGQQGPLEKGMAIPPIFLLGESYTDGPWPATIH